MQLDDATRTAQRPLPPVRAMNPFDVWLKHVLDRILAALLIVFSSPLLLLLALIVRLDSPGPAIYRRRVLGRGGVPFDAFKFRTMFVNGDEILAAYPELQARLQRDEKLKDDPRVTRSGRWMRKLSLDELPQLFNVLHGQMSLVGPRMISPPELPRFGDYAQERLTVKPGLTGLWQVSGRADTGYDERVYLDICYIRTRSLWLDLKLLLLTIPAVLKGKGAY